MKRYLAHKVIVDGRAYVMSVLTVNDDGSVMVEPFTNEVHSTTFLNGELSVITRPGKMPILTHNSSPLKPWLD